MSDLLLGARTCECRQWESESDRKRRSEPQEQIAGNKEIARLASAGFG